MKQLQYGPRRLLSLLAMALFLCACEKETANQVSKPPVDSDTTTDNTVDSVSEDTEDLTPLPVDTETVEEINIITDLPDGFNRAAAGTNDTEAPLGGYMVIGPLEDIELESSEKSCANVLRVVMRDFSQAHADFDGGCGHTTVAANLGEDRKPVRASDNCSNVFDEWYRNVPGVNIPFAVDLWLEPAGDKFVFASSCFFPLDGHGFDETSTAGCDNQPHNFHFTTELHSTFEYKGGEVFTFIGDDDVYVYINRQLVVDLHGIHPAMEGSVYLDDVAGELGLEIGQVYELDLFQAERQCCGSNFRIETTLDFTGCGQILESDITID
jgi:fibro-slime domain-containing protein